MALIGRTKEVDILDQCMSTGRPEFVAIYGRRRVGKTYLVREYFKGCFSFYATGIANQKMSAQLRVFGLALRDCGWGDGHPPRDWFDAFDQLKDLLESEIAKRDAFSGRRVVFLDELPWFDTPRSEFKSALDWFWNGWASSTQDVMLVVCGSAASWILDNLVGSSGGFHNRVTRQIHLMPFSLGECEALLAANGIPFTRRQVVECYMVFGGIPFYLNLLDRRMSLAQNVDALCFDPSGELRFERQRLLTSLFKHSQAHAEIIDALSSRMMGLTRTEIARRTGRDPGKGLTKALLELEQCGFIRRYQGYAKKKNGNFYQLVDPFVLFSLRFLEEGGPGSWLEYLETPGYRAWSGLAFELVCLLHVPQMKQALGISGVRTRECAWRSAESIPGAQIDLLIDRADGVVNLCEMKYCKGEFTIDADCERELGTKLDAFAREGAPDKALHLTMVTMGGVARNAHAGLVVAQITADDLFA